MNILLFFCKAVEPIIVEAVIGSTVKPGDKLLIFEQWSLW